MKKKSKKIVLEHFFVDIFRLFRQQLNYLRDTTTWNINSNIFRTSTTQSNNLLKRETKFLLSFENCWAKFNTYIHFSTGYYNGLNFCPDRQHRPGEYFALVITKTSVTLPSRLITFSSPAKSIFFFNFNVWQLKKERWYYVPALMVTHCFGSFEFSFPKWFSFFYTYHPKQLSNISQCFLR
jgi:hypothetical protein